MLPFYKHTRKTECYEGDTECKPVIEVEETYWMLWNNP